jgi:hypothetical protein
MEIVYLCVGLFCGSLITYLWLQQRRTMEMEQSVMRHPLTIQMKDAHERLVAELRGEREKLLEHATAVAGLREKNAALVQRQTEYASDLVALKRQFQDEFEHLAHRIFEERSIKFNEQNKQQLDNVLHPFKDKLREFENRDQDAGRPESQTVHRSPSFGHGIARKQAARPLGRIDLGKDFGAKRIDAGARIRHPGSDRERRWRSDQTGCCGQSA